MTAQKTLLDAYNCERELLLNLMEIEEVGVRINLESLLIAIELQKPVLKNLEVWLKNRLGGEEINLNSTVQVRRSLVDNDFIDVEKAHLTKTGEISIGKDSLKACMIDKELLSVFLYRVQLTKCLNTFMVPWARMASANDGVLYTTWNQIAGSFDASGKKKGARTGRLSSSPNFQNQPKKYKPLFLHEGDSKEELPACPLGDIPLMPVMRSFIIPRFDDHVLVDLDYSQQEIRILAHFEDGQLLTAYQEDPTLDVHKLAVKLLKEKLGKTVERDAIKIIVFSILYGKGINKLAKDLRCTKVEAEALVDAYYTIFPGVKDINDNLRERAAQGLPFRTLGGRLVKCEPPFRDKKGKLRDLSYKMINTQCQGSAGDATKIATNNYMRNKPENHHMVLQVHDEFLLSVPKDEVELGLKILKEAMEGVPCDVLLLADGKGHGAQSWDLLK